MEGLRDRFSLDEGGGILLSRRGGAGGDGLVDGMFNFAADKNDASELDIELRDLLTTSTASNHRGEPLKTNTIHIYKWLNDRLKQVAPACAAKRKAADAATAAADAAARAAALAASADDAATAAANAAASAAAAAAATAQAAADIAASMRAAKQATWLLGLLETFRCRVQWTTSLTASRSLALHTFLNVNLDSHRVPLKEIDVIKVALVSDISKEVRCNIHTKRGSVSHSSMCGMLSAAVVARRHLLLPVYAALLCFVPSAAISGQRTGPLAQVHQGAGRLR